MSSSDGERARLAISLSPFERLSLPIFPGNGASRPQGGTEIAVPCPFASHTPATALCVVCDVQKSGMRQET